MGQVLIRNLDDDLLAAYRAAVKENDRSLEAELCAARPVAKPSREELLALSQRLRAMTPPGERVPGWVLIREARDGNREA